MTTRGLVFRGPGQPLELEKLVLDEPREGEVLVRMVASGVCHSDLHVVDGEWERPADVVLGHEGAAIVERLGPGVTLDRLARRSARASPRATSSCSPGRRHADDAPRAGAQEAWLCTTPRGSGHRLAPEVVRLRRADGERDRRLLRDRHVR